MKIRKIFLSGVLAATMALSVFASAGPAANVEAASKGPKTGEESYANIALAEDSEELSIQWFLFKADAIGGDADEALKYEESDLTYSKKTNTLTFNNFNHPTYCLAVNQMGDDFKIVLKGKNQVQNLAIYGDNYGGSVTIKGTGSLTCNKNKKSKLYGAGIILGAENTASKISIAKTCTVTAFSNKYTGYDLETYEEVKMDGHPIVVYADKLGSGSKVIKSAGKVSGAKFKTKENANNEGLYDIYCVASKYVSKKK
ncbi:MAG: hypothetical protein K6B14_12300 [Lachnospiraceae bacterium]|nr:hypothetical protein [Lachnospiraceae bacterium]